MDKKHISIKKVCIMFKTIKILEEFCKKSNYNIKKIEIFNKDILATGKDFLLMDSIVISVANNGWVASIYPDLYRISSKNWVVFSWNSKFLSNKYDQFLIKDGKLIAREGKIETGLLLLEFMSLMQYPIKDDSYKEYMNSCDMMSQLGWKKILKYPFYPSNTENGLELYTIYGPIVFKNTKYVPIKLTVSNVYYFPEALHYLSDEEIQKISQNKYISVEESGIKVVVENEKYRHVDIIAQSLLKVIGVRYQKNWNVINSGTTIKNPLYSLKSSPLSHLMPDYSDIHTMENNIGAIQYKKTHTGGSNG